MKLIIIVRNLIIRIREIKRKWSSPSVRTKEALDSFLEGMKYYDT